MWMPLGSSWGSEITAMIGQGGGFQERLLSGQGPWGWHWSRHGKALKWGVRGWVMPLYCLLGKAFNDIHNS